MAACGGDDDESGEPATSAAPTEATTETETGESAAPPEGEVDPLALLGAAGPAGNEFDNAFIEHGVLVLTLRGDPTDVDTDEIKRACAAMRKATGAVGVEVETPDRTRTKVC